MGSDERDRRLAVFCGLIFCAQLSVYLSRDHISIIN